MWHLAYDRKNRNSRKMFRLAMVLCMHRRNVPQRVGAASSPQMLARYPIRIQATLSGLISAA